MGDSVDSTSAVQVSEHDRGVLQILATVIDGIEKGMETRNTVKITNVILGESFFTLPTIESCREAGWTEPLENALKNKNICPSLKKALSETLQSMDKRIEPDKISFIGKKSNKIEIIPGNKNTNRAEPLKI